MQDKKKKLRHIVLLILLSLALAWVNFGQAMMQSANFRVDSDVIGSEGGPSGSANYRATDTMGEAAIGESGSASYKTKAGFWYMGGQAAAPGLGLTCEATSVYMTDYELGSSADGHNTYLFSDTQECIVADNTTAAWSLTLTSTNMTGTKNVIPNSDIKISTDGMPSTEPTITIGGGGNIGESAGDCPLDSDPACSVVSGAGAAPGPQASGNYNSRTTIRLENLNNLYQETNDTATFTFTVS